MRNKKVFEVHFIEDDFASNDIELRVTPGDRRFIFRIAAATAEEAYLEGVKRARLMTDKTFRLNYCKIRQ